MSDVSNSILVVDDNLEVCNSLSRILGSKYYVSISTNPKTASEILLDQEFAIVILDYDLQDETDGIMLSEFISEIHPLTYVIMITGHSDMQTTQRALNEGNINKYITKPLDSKKLIEIVDDGIAEYNSKKEISEMLLSEDGIDFAREFLNQVFDELPTSKKGNTDLVAVIISRNSIPIYSNFLEETYLKKFTDTIFSGFITAINLVGQEALDTESKVEIMKFGYMTIYLKFFKQYQFCFILHNENEILDVNVKSSINHFVESVKEKIKLEKNYFNIKTRYFEDINSQLSEISKNLLAA